jgi:hypothetical protein
MGVLETISTAINSIPNILQQFFIVARNIIWEVEVLFLNMYVILTILTFFGIIALVIWLPVKIYPLYLKHRKIFKKLLFF